MPPSAPSDLAGHTGNTVPSVHRSPPSAPRPSSALNEAVLPGVPPQGKIDPSRRRGAGRDTPAGGRDDRAAPLDCVGAALERRAGTERSPPADTRGRSRRAPGRTAGRSKTAGCSAGNCASEAASPRAPRLEARFIPLDSRGDRRHTPVVEHVSTCQTLEGPESLSPGPHLRGSFSARRHTTAGEPRPPPTPAIRPVFYAST
jgi:hypothetical protein